MFSPLQGVNMAHFSGINTETRSGMRSRQQRRGWRARLFSGCITGTKQIHLLISAAAALLFFFFFSSSSLPAIIITSSCSSCWSCSPLEEAAAHRRGEAHFFFGFQCLFASSYVSLLVMFFFPFFFIFNASALTSTFCSFFCFLKILYRNTQDLKLVGQILDVISFSLHVITAEIHPDILWLFLERRAAPENNVWCFIHYHICALEETTIKTEKVNLISSHWFVSHRMKRAVDIFLYHFSLFFSVLHLDWSIQ